MCVCVCVVLYVCVCVCVELKTGPRVLFKEMWTAGCTDNTIQYIQYNTIQIIMRIWTILSNVHFAAEWLNSHRKTWHLMFKHEKGGFWWRELCNVNTVCTRWTLVLSDVPWLGEKEKNSPEFIYTDCVVLLHRTLPLRGRAFVRSLHGHFLYVITFQM